MQGWPTFIAATSLVAIAPAAHATVYLSVEQAQQAIFPGGAFVPSGANGEARIWRVAGGGWFFVDRVIGKHDFVTYALGLDAGGKVRAIEILEYREAYGYEVRAANWRGQFIGKSAADPLQLGEDIRNISGATLSCRHVTAGVKRLLSLYDASLKGH